MFHATRIDRKTAGHMLLARLTLALFSLCLLSLLLTPAGAGAEGPCPGSCNVTVQGINPSYKPGENISGTAVYSISNDSQCPGCSRQLLIGIADERGWGYDAVCVYDATPRACPAITGGSAQFVLPAPCEPGVYRVLTSCHLQGSGEMARRSFTSSVAEGTLVAVIQVAAPAPVASIPKPATPAYADITASWLKRYSPFLIIAALVAGGTALMIWRKRARRLKGKGLPLKAELGIIAAATVALAVTVAVVFRDQAVAGLIEIAVKIYFLL
jgi:hypothetical protein